MRLEHADIVDFCLIYRYRIKKVGGDAKGEHEQGKKKKKKKKNKKKKKKREREREREKEREGEDEIRVKLKWVRETSCWCASCDQHGWLKLSRWKMEGLGGLHCCMYV